MEWSCTTVLVLLSLANLFEALDTAVDRSRSTHGENRGRKYRGPYSWELYRLGQSMLTHFVDIVLCDLKKENLRRSAESHRSLPLPRRDITEAGTCAAQELYLRALCLVGANFLPRSQACYLTTAVTTPRVASFREFNITAGGGVLARHRRRGARRGEKEVRGG